MDSDRSYISNIHNKRIRIRKIIIHYMYTLRIIIEGKIIHHIRIFTLIKN